MGLFGSYFRIDAHIIVLKQWKLSCYVYTEVEVLVNRTATLFYSSSR